MMYPRPFVRTTLAAMLVAALGATASADTLQPFAIFSDQGKEYPESIARDAAGNLYLSLTTGKAIKRVTPAGVQSTFATINDNWLLGVTVDGSGNLLVAGNKGIWKVTPAGSASLWATVPGHKSLNDLTLDASGAVYASDDALHVIWKLDATGNAVIWSSDPLLSVTDTSSFPIPTGANGLAFSRDERTLFVSNTSDGTIVALPVQANGSAGTGRIVASGYVGVDGIRTDGADNIYVANNIQNRILKITKSGTVTTLYSGGLLAFPTSLVLGGPNQLFICNNGNAFISNSPAWQGVLTLTNP